MLGLGLVGSVCRPMRTCSWQLAARRGLAGLSRKWRGWPRGPPADPRRRVLSRGRQPSTRRRVVSVATNKRDCMVCPRCAVARRPPTHGICVYVCRFVSPCDHAPSCCRCVRTCRPPARRSRRGPRRRTWRRRRRSGGRASAACRRVRGDSLSAVLWGQPRVWGASQVHTCGSCHARHVCLVASCSTPCCSNLVFCFGGGTGIAPRGVGVVVVSSPRSRANQLCTGAASP